MSITNIDDYLYTKQIDLDLVKIKQSSIEMYKLIVKNFGDGRQDYTGQSTYSTKLYNNYNVLLYPFPQFYELYEEIKKVFYEVKEKNDYKYYIQCWLNVYKHGDFIDWHGHWPSEMKVWHGFYCLDTEPSYTSYKLPHREDIVDVKSIDNQLVIGKSDNDKHRSSEWKYPHRDRITIAFDIVPRQSLLHSFPYNGNLNHWIPI